MTHEDFKKEIESIDNEKLYNMAIQALSKLCKTGGRSFVMTVPPRADDTDIILSEVILRFQKSFTKIKKVKEEYYCIKCGELIGPLKHECK